MNSPEMRKFLYKTKDTGSLEKRFSLKSDLEGNLHVFPGSEASPTQDTNSEPDRPPPQQQRNYFDPSNLSYLDVLTLSFDGRKWLLTLIANRGGAALLELREIQES